MKRLDRLREELPKVQSRIDADPGYKRWHDYQMKERLRVDIAEQEELEERLAAIELRLKGKPCA